MDLNKRKPFSRKVSLQNKMDSFEMAFRRFRELPGEKMIISRFTDKVICREELGYDAIFRDDYQVCKQIVNYYKTGIVGSKIAFVVPCEDIYKRLVYMGFTTFDLKEERSKKVEVMLHVGANPFDVNRFLAAYALFVEQGKAYNEFKKAKAEKLTKTEYRQIYRDYTKEASAKFLGYPRSFSADIENVKKAFWYGVSENAEIDIAMRKESVVKALIDAGFDFSLRFADVKLEFSMLDYLRAMIAFNNRYGTIDVPSTYDFYKARAELNYCGNLGAENALVISVLSKRVRDDVIEKQLKEKRVKDALNGLGIKATSHSKVEFDFNLYKKTLKAFKLKYKTTNVDSSFDVSRSMEEFSYPRSLFEDSCMLRDAYHGKPVVDAKIAQAMKGKQKPDELKLLKFDFWPAGYER